MFRLIQFWKTYLLCLNCAIIVNFSILYSDLSFFQKIWHIRRTLLCMFFYNCRVKKEKSLWCTWEWWQCVKNWRQVHIYYNVNNKGEADDNDNENVEMTINMLIMTLQILKMAMNMSKVLMLLQVTITKKKTILIIIKLMITIKKIIMMFKR
jgi:hypothetical protein